MEREKGVVVGDVHTVSGMTPCHHRRFVCTALVCEKRARLPRATRASKYWLLFESVIRCLRTHGFSPHVSTLPYLIRDYHCRRYFNPRPPSLTRISTPLLSAPCIFGSAGNSTFPSVQVDFCEATRFIAPTFRSLVNHALSKIRFRLPDICKK